MAFKSVNRTKEREVNLTFKNVPFLKYLKYSVYLPFLFEALTDHGEVQVCDLNDTAMCVFPEMGR